MIPKPILRDQPDGRKGEEELREGVEALRRENIRMKRMLYRIQDDLGQWAGVSDG
jgi:hypothetical protein